MSDFPFHVVRHSHNDKLVTHSIYKNNKPFLKPPRGEKLSRRLAHRIMRLLNGHEELSYDVG
jgi:hypothetical protein